MGQFFKRFITFLTGCVAVLYTDQCYCSAWFAWFHGRVVVVVGLDFMMKMILDIANVLWKWYCQQSMQWEPMLLLSRTVMLEFSLCLALLHTASADFISLGSTEKCALEWYLFFCSKAKFWLKDYFCFQKCIACGMITKCTLPTTSRSRNGPLPDCCCSFEDLRDTNINTVRTLPPCYNL